jgi:hypothetical protein
MAKLQVRVSGDSGYNSYCTGIVSTGPGYRDTRSLRTDKEYRLSDRSDDSRGRYKRSVGGKSDFMELVGGCDE